VIRPIPVLAPVIRATDCFIDWTFSYVIINKLLSLLSDNRRIA